MADLIQDGAAFLNQMRSAHLAKTIEYRRGDVIVSVPATVGQTEFEVADDYGGRMQSHVRDFLILADDLGMVPEAGDLIVLFGHKYEVMDLAGEGVWRWSDPYRTTYRIHTKDVGVDI